MTENKKSNVVDLGAAALPPDVRIMPGHLIRRMHQASQAIFDAEMAAAGFDLTSVQFAALAATAAHPGIDQARLATAIAFDRATTGGVIDRLEAKGHLRREIPKHDRRARQVFATASGLDVLAAVRPIVDRVQTIMLQGLSAAERVSLCALLEKAIYSANDAPGHETTPQPRRTMRRATPA